MIAASGQLGSLEFAADGVCLLFTPSNESVLLAWTISLDGAKFYFVNWQMALQARDSYHFFSETAISFCFDMV